MFKRISELRKEYYKLAIGKEELLKMIAEAEVPEQVYNSNAIENSTLTLEETEKILLEMDLDRFVSERELFEAKNLARVVEYTNKIAKKRELDLDMILFLHKMLISNIQDDIAGRFRAGNEMVRVGSHIAPPPGKIVEQLEAMLAEYNADSDVPIYRRMAKLHLKFEHTHPFIDGNGRIGRAINNYLLIREGYVPINIRFANRAEYYDAFREFDKNGSVKIMEEIIGRAIINSYYKRLAYLKGKSIIKLSDYAKQNRLSHSNLLNKAKRQTIPAFRERGVWKIGV